MVRHAFSSHSREAGTSLTEFLLILPALGALLYAAQFLHDIIEHRQVMEIDARNVLHATPQGAESFKELISRSSPVHASKWQTESASSVGADPQDRQRVKAVVGDGGSFVTLSRSIGTVAAETAVLLDEVQNFSVRGNFLLLPTEVTKEDARLRTSIDHPLVKPVAGFLGAMSAGWGVRVRESTFHRPEVGYHPDPYQYQAILGFLMAKLGDRAHWYELVDQAEVSFSLEQSVFSSEVEQKYLQGCLMNFVANSKCAYEPQNLLALTIRTIGVVKGIIQTILDIFSGSATEEMNLAAKAAADEAVSYLVEELAEKAKDKLVDEGMNEAKTLVSEKLTQFEQRLKAEMTDQQWLDVFATTRDRIGGENVD